MTTDIFAAAYREAERIMAALGLTGTPYITLSSAGYGVLVDAVNAAALLEAGAAACDWHPTDSVFGLESRSIRLQVEGVRFYAVEYRSEPEAEGEAA